MPGRPGKARKGWHRIAGHAHQLEVRRPLGGRAAAVTAVRTLGRLSVLLRCAGSWRSLLPAPGVSPGQTGLAVPSPHVLTQARCALRIPPGPQELTPCAEDPGRGPGPVHCPVGGISSGPPHPTHPAPAAAPRRGGLNAAPWLPWPCRPGFVCSNSPEKQLALPLLSTRDITEPWAGSDLDCPPLGSCQAPLASPILGRPAGRGRPSPEPSVVGLG